MPRSLARTETSSRVDLVLLVGVLLLTASLLPAQPSELAMDDLLAWCIVPFDNQGRTPEARIRMLEELGFTRYAYDWRPKHLADTARELRLAEQRGIDVTAVWMWIAGEGDRPGQLSESNERLLAALAEAGLSTQIWVGFDARFFEFSTPASRGRSASSATWRTPT